MAFGRHPHAKAGNTRAARFLFPVSHAAYDRTNQRDGAPPTSFVSRLNGVSLSPISSFGNIFAILLRKRNKLWNGFDSRKVEGFSFSGLLFHGLGCGKFTISVRFGAQGYRAQRVSVSR